MSKLDRIIDIIRSLHEDGVVASVPTNNASSGNIAGLPPDQPPGIKKRIYLGKGSRKPWMRKNTSQ